MPAARRAACPLSCAEFYALVVRLEFFVYGDGEYFEYREAPPDRSAAVSCYFYVAESEYGIALYVELSPAAVGDGRGRAVFRPFFHSCLRYAERCYLRAAFVDEFKRPFASGGCAESARRRACEERECDCQ